MARPVPQHSEPVNGDSFLDIVASVVSIMIIMVVMEGMRIKNAPVKVSIPATPATVDLEKDLAEEQSLKSDIWRLAADVRNVQREIMARGMQRDALATLVTAADHDVQQRRQRLDAVKRGDFDTARAMNDAKMRLEQLARQRVAASQATGQPIVVESYPTPISRIVDGPEAHLLITDGRVVFVPLDKLVEAFKNKGENQVYRLKSEDRVADSVGPVENFRLHYTLERREAPPEKSRYSMGSRSYVHAEFKIEPTDDKLGEPVRLALEQGSDFRRELRKYLPGRVTVTVWVYPDGFDAFRQIRKELYRMGYSVAARPLPPGELIGGSPEGSKSAAQ